jgi:hypothetical protein
VENQARWLARRSLLSEDKRGVGGSGTRSGIVAVFGRTWTWTLDLWHWPWLGANLCLFFPPVSALHVPKRARARARKGVSRRSPLTKKLPGFPLCLSDARSLPCWGGPPACVSFRAHLCLVLRGNMMLSLSSRPALSFPFHFSCHACLL